MRRSILYIVILGVLCIAVGLVAGIGIERMHTSKYLPQIVKDYLSKNPGSYDTLKSAVKLFSKDKPKGSSESIFKKLSRELKLSSEQKDKLRIILNDAKQEIDETRTQFRSGIGRIQEKAILKISEILGPRQKDKFQSLVTKFKRGRINND